MQNDKIKVAFLDRDGVINKEVNYLHRIEDFEYTTSCVSALKRLRELGFHIIIVTNQAGIARGYYTEQQYQELTSWYLDDLKNFGVDVLDVFHCPHHPEGAVEELKLNCECRKPKAGLLFQALDKYKVDLDNSILVGDKVTDIEAAKRARIKNAYLVTTGHNIKKPNAPVYESLYSLIGNLEKQYRNNEL